MKTKKKPLILKQKENGLDRWWMMGIVTFPQNVVLFCLTVLENFFSDRRRMVRLGISSYDTNKHGKKNKSGKKEKTWSFSRQSPSQIRFRGSAFTFKCLHHIDLVGIHCTFSGPLRYALCETAYRYVPGWGYMWLSEPQVGTPISFRDVVRWPEL